MVGGDFMDEAVGAQIIAPFFGFDKSNPYGASRLQFCGYSV